MADRIIAAGIGGVMRVSEDPADGSTNSWSPVLLEPVAIGDEITGIAQSHLGVWVAVTDQGRIWRSTDGETWALIEDTDAIDGRRAIANMRVGVSGNGIVEGETFTLIDGSGNPFVFEFDLDGSVVDGSAAATGEIVAVAGSDLVDGESFTLKDARGVVAIFEFDSGGGVTAGRVPVTFSGGDNPGDVGSSITQAINDSSLAITASGIFGITSLTQDDIGVLGNNTITETVSNTGFVVTGFSGGADLFPVPRIPVPYTDAALGEAALALEIATAINGSVAGFAAVANGGFVTLTQGSSGISGNTVITDTVAAAVFNSKPSGHDFFGGESRNYNAVTHDQTFRFIAVGSTGDEGFIKCSVDGLTWVDSTPAEATLLAIPGASLELADQFTLTDTEGTSLTFRFEQGAGVPGGIVSILLTQVGPGSPDTASDVGDAMALAINGAAIKISASHVGSGKVIVTQDVAGAAGKTLVVNEVSGSEATGSLSTIPGADIVDGDNFTLEDALGNVVVFEFDDDGSVVETPTLRQVVFSGGDSANDVRDTIITAVTNSVLDMTAIPSAGTVNLFQSTGGVAGNNTILENTSGFTPGVVANGSMIVVPGTLLNDGETFTLQDAAGLVVVFEFDDDGSVSETPTLRQVVFNPADGNVLVTRDAVRDAINNSDLEMTAAVPGAALVTMTQDDTGLSGNTTIAETVADTGFSVTDFANGVDDILFAVSGFSGGADFITSVGFSNGFKPLNGVAYDKNSPKRWVAAADAQTDLVLGGALISVDGGLLWEQVTSIDTTESFLDVVSVDDVGSTTWVLVGGEAWSSSDGETWSFEIDFGSFLLRSVDSIPGIGFVAAGTTATPSGLIYSADADGSSWVNQSSGIGRELFSIVVNGDRIVAAGGLDEAIIGPFTGLHGTDPTVRIASTADLSSWTTQQYGSPDPSDQGFPVIIRALASDESAVAPATALTLGADIHIVDAPLSYSIKALELCDITRESAFATFRSALGASVSASQDSFGSAGAAVVEAIAAMQTAISTVDEVLASNPDETTPNSTVDLLDSIGAMQQTTDRQEMEERVAKVLDLNVINGVLFPKGQSKLGALRRMFQTLELSGDCVLPDTSRDFVMVLTFSETIENVVGQACGEDIIEFEVVETKIGENITITRAVELSNKPEDEILIRFFWFNEAKSDFGTTTRLKALGLTGADLANVLLAPREVGRVYSTIVDTTTLDNLSDILSNSEICELTNRDDTNSGINSVPTTDEVANVMRRASSSNTGSGNAGSVSSRNKAGTSEGAITPNTPTTGAGSPQGVQSGDGGSSVPPASNSVAPAGRSGDPALMLLAVVDIPRSLGSTTEAADEVAADIEAAFIAGLVSQECVDIVSFISLALDAMESLASEAQGLLAQIFGQLGAGTNELAVSNQFADCLAGANAGLSSSFNALQQLPIDMEAYIEALTSGLDAAVSAVGSAQDTICIPEQVKNMLFGGLCGFKPFDFTGCPPDVLSLLDRLTSHITLVKNMLAQTLSSLQVMKTDARAAARAAVKLKNKSECFAAASPLGNILGLAESATASV